ncbi:hypothetical protein [Rhizobium sp. M10]|uniref:hypothetical protein n=1 Tax=Rhizobium sp. M10 TaxID=1324586 RepID=UPI001AECD35E|nr:hypothetical protein [Rhizobium sp. M10]
MSETLQRRSFLAGLWAGLLSALLSAMRPASAANQPPHGARQQAEGRKGKAGIHPWIGVGEEVTAEIMIDGKAMETPRVEPDRFRRRGPCATWPRFPLRSMTLRDR